MAVTESNSELPPIQIGRDFALFFTLSLSSSLASMSIAVTATDGKG
jgi:hypothetical protein